MKQHAGEFGLAAMCRVLRVHRSGYYAWLRSPASLRARDDQRLLKLIKHSWLESGSIYGHRKITKDLRELGETCSKHRVARLMKQEGLRAMVALRPASAAVELGRSARWPTTYKRVRSQRRSRTRRGSPTSPTFAPTRASCI